MISADLTKAKMKLAPAYLSQAEESIRCHKDHTLAISDSTKAIGLFEELMSINKIGEEQIKKDLALSYYYRGVANKRVGDKDASLADFEKAKSLDPTCTPENREKIKSSALKQEFSTPPFSARDAGVLPPTSQSKVSLHSSAYMPDKGSKRKLNLGASLSETIDKRRKAVNSRAQHESADFQLGE
jgi:tetratricopeptide (TPR) repeat protein